MASVIKRMKNKAGSKKGGASFQFEFAIAVHSVDFVVADKKWTPESLVVEWKRNHRVATSKGASGLKVDGGRGSASFGDEELVMIGSLSKDDKDAFDTKEYKISLDDVRDKKGKKTLARLVIDLARYANITGKTFNETLTLTPESTKISQASLTVTISSRFVREGAREDDEASTFSANSFKTSDAHALDSDEEDARSTYSHESRAHGSNPFDDDTAPPTHVTPAEDDASLSVFKKSKGGPSPAIAEPTSTHSPSSAAPSSSSAAPSSSSSSSQQANERVAVEVEIARKERDQALDDLNRTNARAERAKERYQRDMESVKADRDKLAEDNAALQKQLETLNKDKRELAAKLASVDTDKGSKQAEVRDQLSAAEARAAAAIAEAESLRAQLAQASRQESEQIARLDSKLASVTAERDTATASLASASKDRERLRAQLDENKAALANTSIELLGAQEDLAALRLQADASPKQGQTEARLDDALKEALASKQRADAAERARNAIEKESEGKVLAERQRADEAEGKAAELARRVQEAHAEVEAYKERIATAEQEVQAAKAAKESTAAAEVDSAALLFEQQAAQRLRKQLDDKSHEVEVLTSKVLALEAAQRRHDDDGDDDDDQDEDDDGESLRRRIAELEKRTAFLEGELDTAETTAAADKARLERSLAAAQSRTDNGQDDDDDDDQEGEDTATVIRDLQGMLKTVRHDLDAAEDELDKERSAHADTQEELDRILGELKALQRGKGAVVAVKAAQPDDAARAKADMQELTKMLIEAKVAMAEAQFRADSADMERRKVAKELAKEKLKMLEVQKKLTTLEVENARKK